MTTAIKGIQILAATCKQAGISKVVFSPGSRSAPLVIAFSQIPEIECVVIPDERVAGYFALGIAQQTRQTVAIVCTSGTALLNLAPAVCEAFYQKTPLLLLTADRPPEAIGLGENQAIDQREIYQNYIKESRNIDADNTAPQLIATVVSDSIALTRTNGAGPVHLNLHLREPLYNMVEASNEVLDLPTPLPQKNHEAVLSLQQKNMVIVGLLQGNEKLNNKLQKLAKRNDTIVITETTSNQHGEGFINNVDSLLAVMQDGSAYAPRYIVTIGGQIVSKKLKEYLKQHPATEHVHISEAGDAWHSLGAKSFTAVQAEVDNFTWADVESTSNYKAQWQALQAKTNDLAQQYLAALPFCDLKVHELLANSFPQGANVQYGNSTPIRYSNLFKLREDLTVNSNRGTSGIDGCVSTATGAAFANGKPTVLVVGDISFLYDSNALWNNYLSPHLRIVIINNSGGNIFRVLDGPNKVQGFETFFETKHNHTAKHLASMYGIPYYFCAAQAELEEQLKTFFEPGKHAKILEIKTDNELSAAKYKGYFENLRNSRQ
ncbi:MAG: 2-succinyl-5-enolpyruvyl-6-hydroxy-3-cyclohexene-1-carboxylic-acid synthase [Bacteroidetes bacterium]|nr:2-succinyl-5-enolpyruvyl-6-hydroxy-3-cyclohexene-1-carboxylic-acid synthase [Bacteroidota bacterium]